MFENNKITVLVAVGTVGNGAVVVIGGGIVGGCGKFSPDAAAAAPTAPSSKPPTGCSAPVLTRARPLERPEDIYFKFLFFISR
jgi:hypothetical protein